MVRGSEMACKNFSGWNWAWFAKRTAPAVGKGSFVSSTKVAGRPRAAAASRQMPMDGSDS